MLLVHLVNNTGGGTGPEEHIRFNGDAGSNYAGANSNNGAIDSAVTNQTVNFFSRTNGFNDKWIYAYIDNNPTGEKLMTGHDHFHVTPLVSYPGTVPDRNESKNKWTNVLDPITDILVGNIIGNIAGCGVGSEAVLLGFDPADGGDASLNFWQELASVEITSPAGVITATFPAKKYLWIQYYFKGINGTVEFNETFNSDAGNNYCSRRRINGNPPADVPATNNDKIDIQSGVPLGFTWYGEQFIINKQDKQKLVHEHDSSRISAGLSFPSRQEIVAVWDNTASQITRIDIDVGLAPGDYDIGSTLKVWGHD
jgi:hypothetical protein